VSEYALILEENPTRAAQYARMVEMAELVPTSARSAEEATFHISRLGTPRLVIIELAAPGDSQLQFLRDLRHLASAGTGAPVVAIVDSRAMYEQAARHMIELNIVALLTRSHNLSAVDRAIRVTLSKPLAAPGTWNDATRPPSQPQAVNDALEGSGVPHAYLLFEGEQHGFRKAESNIAALEAELSFYGQVFGFEPPGVPQLPLRH
jgi:DNA-binding response OmpR family regulator